MSQPSFRWKAGKYSNHARERMESLEGVELAPFSSRAIAFVIDFLFAFFLFMILAILGSRLLIALDLLHLEEDVKFKFNFQNPWSFVFIVLYFGFFTFLTNGKTLGKWIMRIRVLSVSHGKISLWHSIERSLGYAASTLEFGFGFVQYFIHPNRCTVHDRIAETIVVKERGTKKHVK